MRILVVDDDSKMAELLRRGLEGQGHKADLAFDGIKGLEKAETATFDVIVLDVMLPGIDGFQIAKRLRAGGIHTPILMLTARDSVSDIVRGLDMGADDYLTKPFSFDVFAARVRAMGRRKATEAASVLQVANLVLNTETHEVHRGKKLLNLTRTEFVILEHLMRRPGRVVSRDDLIQAAWGIDREVESNTLDVFIFQLRSKIEAAVSGRIIQTVRGFGYTIRESDS
jgi:DNA-binding response OmpR family regulator